MGPTVVLVLVVLTAVYVPLVRSQLVCPDGCSCLQDAATSLGIIDCSDLSLTDIPAMYHPAGGNLFKVDLSNNKLTTLDIDQLFRLIRGLRVDVLDFSNNNIHTVSGEFDFNKGKDYAKLNLSNNAFTEFPSNVIPKTHGRDELVLDFSYNKLTEMTRHMFAKGDDRLFGFQFLASNNLISQIHDEALRGATITDTVLDLRSNMLSTLSEGFQLPTGVREFRFANNPWRCDCNLRWIIAPRRTIINATKKDPPNCFSPLSLQGRPIFNLTADEFHCPPYQDGPLRIKISKRGTATLSCPVMADPPNPVITWTVWLPCPDVDNPLRVFVRSDEFTVTDIGNHPGAVFKCAAMNNAGVLNLDLDVRYNDI